MKEVENRFELIRIAVGLADHETIDLQVKHLRNFSTDTRLHGILQELEQKNFRQALFMMRAYLSEPEDDFFHENTSQASEEPSKTTKEESPKKPEPEQGLFDLEPPHEESQEGRILGLDDMLRMTKESAKKPRNYAPNPTPAETEARKIEDETESDPLFALDQEIEPEVSAVPSLDTSSTDRLMGIGEAAEGLVIDPIPDFVGEEPGAETAEAASAFEENASVDRELFAFSEEEPDTFPAYEEPELSHEPLLSEEKEEGHDYQPHETAEIEAEETPEPMLAPHAKPQEDASLQVDVFDFDSEGGQHYAPFAYMGQKYRNMLHQYPQIETREEGISDEVQRFIDRVSTRDYTESQVEAVIARYQELRDEGRLAEAAQMLIAAATTESTFAQFMLARELFKGEVLQQDYPEAFTQINHLAEEDYPEAICDLGQLYEYGIGIDKNKRHALLLYEEAAEMGVERARRHHERLSSSHPVKALSALFRRKG